MFMYWLSVAMCFSSPCPTCVFTQRMNHVVNHLFFFSLSTLFVVTHKHFFNTYDHLYKKVACCKTLTHMFGLPLWWHSRSLLIGRLSVLIRQMFVLSLCGVPVGMAPLAAQDIVVVPTLRPKGKKMTGIREDFRMIDDEVPFYIYI